MKNNPVIAAAIPELHIGRRMREITWLCLLILCAVPVAAQDWLSGQGSPVHDSDRIASSSGQRVVIENDDVLLAFDEVSGALVDFIYKRTGWHIQGRADLAESFRIFAPTKDRSYSPILGARNPVSSITRSPDSHSLTIIWTVSVTPGTLWPDVVSAGNRRRSSPREVLRHGPKIDWEFRVSRHPKAAAVECDGAHGMA